MKCPCKDCQNRTITCHAVCRGFLEWKQAREETEAVKQAERDKDRPLAPKAMRVWYKRMKGRR